MRLQNIGLNLTLLTDKSLLDIFHYLVRNVIVLTLIFLMSSTYMITYELFLTFKNRGTHVFTSRTPGYCPFKGNTHTCHSETHSKRKIHRNRLILENTLSKEAVIPPKLPLLQHAFKLITCISRTKSTPLNEHA